MGQIDLPLFSTRAELLDYIAEDTTIYTMVFSVFKRHIENDAKEKGTPSFEGSLRDLCRIHGELDLFIGFRWFRITNNEDGIEKLDEMYGILLKMERVNTSEESTSTVSCVLAFPQEVTNNNTRLYLVVKDVKATLFSYPDNFDNTVWLGDHENAKYLEKKINMKYFRFRIVK